MRLVRQMLKNPAITATTLREALDAILTVGDNLKSWTRLVESAYERLPEGERLPVRILMMGFRYCTSDHEGILKLTPKRITGEFAQRGLVWAIEATFAVGKTDLMKKLARHLPGAIRNTTDEMTRSLLMLSLAEFKVREHKWDEAIAILEAVLPDSVVGRNAVEAIVEVHAIRSLLALRDGFQRAKQFSQDFDLEMELKLPGNNKGMQEDAAKEFRRLQRILEKIVPEKRQKELGLFPEA